MSACAKSHEMPQEELFRRIQVFEAGIAEAQLAVRSATNCREAHGPAEEGVCDPSVALCKLTKGVENRDALQRCLMAADGCRAARERASALCATSASSPPAKAAEAAP
jgi:hypothetical protein